MTVAETPKLLPCPFCGHYATMTHGQYFAVTCSNSGHCRAVTRPFTYEADAIKAWNTRAALTAALSDMVVVPREPTEEMLIAGVIANQSRMVGDVYKAMIAAAPPPVGGKE